jgi:hypothetical protein
VGCAAIGADPWDLALIVADGQIGVFSCVALAMAGAGAMGAVQASRARLGPRGQGY